jgi:TIR domain
MSRQPIKIPTVFISYAWENDVKRWVQGFASRLRADGVDARIDQWEIALGDQLTEYMESSIRENDFVPIICTPLYKLKSDSRQGGVGYEGHIITGEVYANANHRKFIPVLGKGDWVNSAPSFLKSKLYSDLTESSCFEENYHKLLNTLNGTLTGPPPIRSPQASGNSRTSRRASQIELNDGSAVLHELGKRLPRGLHRDENANGATVFIDSQGLQRVKVYEYQTHCKIRVRCSRDWGFRNCKHRRNNRNSSGWLDALRVDDLESLREVLLLYKLEWSTCEP